ncbi:hypothetical protein [Nostoc sp. CMAA1605]|uniref:hypothetical protein n=1 Tax=Nostoc sp. CMAA1605 TaxID=2055159 RepID=UPI001F1BAA1A|nr:hypothetical protein [Nostoc sp. CMAA1605]
MGHGEWGMGHGAWGIVSEKQNYLLFFTFSDFSHDMENPSPNLSPKRREALIFPLPC